MISIRDATVLAVAKIRAKKFRTATAVTVSALLFGIAISALTIVEEGISSATTFNNARFEGRYFVEADYLNDYNELLSNSSIQNRAMAIFNEDNNKKKLIAKRIGIEFDPSSETRPIKQDITGSGAVTPLLDLSSPAAQKALAEYQKSHPSIGLNDLKQIAKQYQPKEFYQIRGLQPVNGSISVMQGGKESFSYDSPNDLFGQNPRIIASSIMTPFLLQNTNLTAKDAIPLLLPYSIAENLLGLTALPNSASPKQKLERLTELYAKARAITFTACYRNSVSKAQIDKAIEAKTNESTSKDAALIYGLPKADSCGPATVERDSRSSQQKLHEQKQQEFEKELGKVTEPEQRKVTLRAIGLVPDDKWVVSNGNLTELTQSFFGPALLGNPTIPSEMYEALYSENKDIFNLSANVRKDFSMNSYIVEFSDLENARRFIAEQSCDSNQGSCGSTSKPFTLTEFGGNSINLLMVKEAVSKASLFIISAIVAVAMVIMAGTFGRIMADERHETAVFRALGATRLDIASIYIVYSFLLSLSVATLALVGGVAGAFLFDLSFSQQATVAAQLTYGLIDGSLQIHFFNLAVPGIWIITSMAIPTGIASMLLPLRHNIGRSIIQDIKNE